MTTPPPVPSGFDPVSIPLPQGVSGPGGMQHLEGEPLQQLRGSVERQLQALLLLCPSVDARPKRMDVEIVLGLAPKELNALCWQLAAECMAQGMTWKSIAAHPAQFLKKDTLEKNYESATLACGMPFTAYVAAYQRACAREMQRLAAESGRALGAKLYRLADESADALLELRATLNSHRRRPGPKACEQIALFDDAPESKRLTLDALGSILFQEKELSIAVKNWQAIFAAQPESPEEDEDEPALAADPAQLLKRAEATQARALDLQSRLQQLASGKAEARA